MWPRDLAASEPPEYDAWRTDLYLQISGSAEVGIKVRNSDAKDEMQRFEVKALVGAMGPVWFTPRAVGRVERWTKWSFPRSELPNSCWSGIASGASGWTTVQKRRMRRLVQLSTADGDVEVSPDTRIERGIGCEIAEVRTEDRVAWSLGFEAFPDDSSLPEAFHRNVCALVNTLPIALELTDSQSYPSWLTSTV
ncbi:MAG: hypothetical protein ACFB9M_00510 [Myxococcota bacterium]